MEESTREEREATSSPKRRGRVKEEKVKRDGSWVKINQQRMKSSKVMSSRGKRQIRTRRRDDLIGQL